MRDGGGTAKAATATAGAVAVVGAFVLPAASVVALPVMLASAKGWSDAEGTKHQVGATALRRQTLSPGEVVDGVIYMAAEFDGLPEELLLRFEVRDLSNGAATTIDLPLGERDSWL